nr:hypothetical protein [Desulforamulus aquiferis]
MVKILRECRPTLILAPYWDDRHPDHINTSRLVQESHFSAGLRKLLPDMEPYRPPQVWYYFLSKAAEPKFIVDISDVYNNKRSAVLAHETQFGNKAGRVETFLNYGPGSLLDLMESRDRYFGSLIGVLHGEGFTTKGPLALRNPLNLLEVFG